MSPSNNATAPANARRSTPLPDWPASEQAATLSELGRVVALPATIARNGDDDGTPESMAIAAMYELIQAEVQAATMRGFIAGRG